MQAIGASKEQYRNLGQELARRTVASAIAQGITAAPERRTKRSWKEFITRQWELIVAADFFTVKV
jgi:hypothetical protein